MENWYQRNKERGRETSRKWYEANKDRKRLRRNVLHRYKYNNDARFRFNYTYRYRLREKLHNAIGGKKSWRPQVLGLDYTIYELMHHLEGLFDSNMNWQNYGSYWEIDHIVPDSKFEYTRITDDGFKESWKLSNLQPLERKTNLSKSNN